MNSKTEQLVTYREVGTRDLMQQEPSCFNNIVRVRKYKVTIELLCEDDGVILDRLMELYKNTSNHYDHESLCRYSFRELGVDLMQEIEERDEKI